jgi:vacuolar-type H+-ATPase subunit D/Vma8
MLAPNKQSLLYLKKQKKLLSNGYKLLKEKQSGLIFMFLETAREGKKLEQELSGELQPVLQAYRQSINFVSVADLLSQLPSEASFNLTTTKKRTSGVYVDSLDIRINPPQRMHLKKDIRKSLTLFAHYFEKLLKVSQLKLNAKRLAQEIQKVNRQIANLERQIESVNSQSKWIKNMLMEKENSEKATLIKMFG